MIDVYVKTFKSDGVIGLYRGFVISCVGIIVYRGCYFGFYDTLKPLLLGEKAGLFVSFMLGYGMQSCLSSPSICSDGLYAIHILLWIRDHPRFYFYSFQFSAFLLVVCCASSQGRQSMRGIGGGAEPPLVKVRG